MWAFSENTKKFAPALYGGVEDGGYFEEGWEIGRPWWGKVIVTEYLTTKIKRIDGKTVKGSWTDQNRCVDLAQKMKEMDESYPISAPLFRPGQIWLIELTQFSFLMGPLCSIRLAKTTRESVGDSLGAKTLRHPVPKKHLSVAERLIMDEIGALFPRNAYDAPIGLRMPDVNLFDKVALLHDPLYPSAAPWTGTISDLLSSR
jgi:hypothetical protein